MRSHDIKIGGSATPPGFDPGGGTPCEHGITGPLCGGLVECEESEKASRVTFLGVSFLFFSLHLLFPFALSFSCHCVCMWETYM